MIRLLSFIFSSRLERPERGFAGLYLLLALIALAEIGVGRSDWVWTYVPRTPTGWFGFMEARIINDESPARVVAFGSSRIRDAIAPRRVERTTELPPGSVYNLGITSGSLSDALYFVRRNPQMLTRRTVAVVGLEYFYFAGNFTTHVTDRDRQNATLHDRLVVFDWNRAEQLRLLGGYLFRFYDARNVARAVVMSILTGVRTPIVMGEDGQIYPGTKPRVIVGPQALTTSPAQRLYVPKPSDDPSVRDAHRVELMAALQSAGTEILIWLPPHRRAYLDTLERDYPYVLEAWGAASRPPFAGFERVFTPSAAEAGLEEIDLRDYGHAAELGKRKLSDWLARRIRKN